jgi:hypothetical protein
VNISEHTKNFKNFEVLNFLNISEYLFLNWYSGGWSPIGSTRHCGHQQAYCASPELLWWWRNWWNYDWHGKPKYSEKTSPSAALSTTNPTCCPDANPGRRDGKPATNRLSFRIQNFLNIPKHQKLDNIRRFKVFWIFRKIQ